MPINTPQYIKSKNTIWNNEIQQVMSVRDFNFINTTRNDIQVLVNSIIMDYVVEYIKLKKASNNIIAPIN